MKRRIKKSYGCKSKKTKKSENERPNRAYLRVRMVLLRPRILMLVPITQILRQARQSSKFYLSDLPNKNSAFSFIALYSAKQKIMQMSKLAYLISTQR